MPIFDIILLIVLLAFFLYGVRKGFLRAVFCVLKNIIAFFAALYLANILSPVFGQKVLAPVLEKLIHNRIAEAVTSTDAAAFTLQSLELGETLTRLLHSDNLVASAVQAITDSFQSSISFVILFILFFILVRLLIAAVGRLLSFVTNHTPLGVVNKFFGGVTGLLAGVLLCFLVFAALKAFSPALFSEIGIFSPETLQQNPVTQFFINTSLADLLKSKF